ncbi:MAG TPA: hypothetical protein VII78_13230 [Myxococcota bacterium]
MSRPVMLLAAGIAIAFGSAAGAEPAASAPKCAQAAEGLPLHDIADVAFDQRGEFKLTSRRGCLSLEEGDFPAGLLALPDFVEPYAVRVAAWVEGSYGYNAKPKVVSPRVTLLDAHFAVTRSFGEAELTRRGEQLALDVFVNPENAAERYLLLHVEPERLGQTERRTSVGSTMTPVVIGTSVAMITSGHDKPQEIEIRATGRFVVSLLGDWAQRFKEERKRTRRRG